MAVDGAGGCNLRKPRLPSALGLSGAIWCGSAAGWVCCLPLNSSLLPLGKQPFVASSTPTTTTATSLPAAPPMIMVATVSTSNEDQGMGTSGPETVNEIHPSSVIDTPFTE
eukprot:scaffold25489_cov238-Isochrysis_galbana.AAC.1